MVKLPDPGLYRTAEAYPGHEEDIPAGVLVYVGVNEETGAPFVVRPGSNQNNRWYWGEPTVPLRSRTWGQTLVQLPLEGFYVLPEDMQFSTGGKWLKNAIVQLGYNADGRGIIFVAEQHENRKDNVLVFSSKGYVIEDHLLNRLIWAPILPVRPSDEQ